MINNLQKGVLACLLGVIASTSASLAGQMYKFDFGTEKSAVFTGSIGVNKDTLYTRNKGYGWSYTATGKSREDFDRTYYDDLCCDLVLVGTSTFNVDVPGGRYYVNFWIGDLHNLYDYLRFGIKAEGQSLAGKRRRHNDN